MRLSIRGLSFISLLTLALPGFAQRPKGWQSTGGPAAQTVTSLVQAGGLMFAGLPHSTNADNGGVYRSADEGRNWKWMTTPASGFRHTGWPYAPDVRQILVDGATLYTATNQGVYSSNDNGATWAELNAGLTGAAFDVYGITRLGNGNLIIATHGAGVFLSNDHGQTWFSHNDGLTGNNNSYYANSVLSTPAGVFVGMNDDEGGLYKSTDGGNNWTQVLDSAGNVIYRSYILAQGPGNLLLIGGDYGGNFDGGAYISTDGGQVWKHKTPRYSGQPSDTNLPFPIEVRAAYISTQGRFELGTARGIYYSADTGRTWRADSTRTLKSQYVTAILETAAGKTFLGTAYAGTYSGNAQLGGGIVMRESRTAPWQQRNFGLPSPVGVVILRTLKDRLFCGVVHAVGAAVGMFGTSDGGRNWSSYSTGLPYAPGGTDFAEHNGDIFVGFYGGGVYRTSDTGRTWAEKNTGMTSLTTYSLTARHDTLFCGALGNMFRSTTNGNTWNTNAIGLSAGPYVYSMRDVGGTLVAGVDGSIYRSNNGGNTWVQAPNYSNGRPAFLRAVNGNTILCGTDQGGGIVRSADKGFTWQAVASPQMGQVYGIAQEDASLLLVGAANGLFFSGDGGLTWQQGNRGLAADTSEASNSVYVGAVAVWHDTVFITAGTSIAAGGVYRRPVSELRALIVADRATLKPSSLALRLYPNPTQGGALSYVEIEAATPGAATLEVTDALGRSLHTEVLALNAGSNRLPLATNGLGAGVYRVRVAQGGATARVGTLVVGR